jgi:effector-binding domain-containing protein
MQKILIAALMLVFSCANAEKQGFYKGYETPKYKLEKTTSGVEFRIYEEYLIAKTNVEGERKQAVKQGFTTLAKYIFGKNKEEKKIAMTSPAVQIKENEKYQVQFAMPRELDYKDLPAPNGGEISFEKLPMRKFIALKFSGIWSDEKIKNYQNELMEFAKRENLEYIGEPIIAYYDDPFTLPWNRRNEILLQIK